MEERQFWQPNFYVLHEDWNVWKLQIASVYLNKVNTILHKKKFKLKGNMPECRNINLHNKHITFEMYTKTSLLLFKTEKIEFSALYHIPLQMKHAETWRKETPMT